MISNEPERREAERLGGDRSAPEPDRGIACRKCGCLDSKVYYVRRSIGGKMLRRRECRHCGHLFTTYEKIA